MERQSWTMRSEVRRKALRKVLLQALASLDVAELDERTVAGYAIVSVQRLRFEWEETGEFTEGPREYGGVT